MSIEDYINNTRKIIDSPNPYFIKYYNHLFDLIKEYCNFEIEIIKLEITYSRNKTAELLYKNANEKYLIYDQYLGQVFNMLNRLFFNSTEPKASEYYCFKLIAEEFQLRGDSENAIICALTYASEIEKYTSYKNLSNQEDRLNYTLIQESFVIAHELSHFIYKSKRTPEHFELARESIITLISEQYSDISNIDFIDSYLNDRHISLVGDNDTYKDYLTDEEIENLKNEFIKDHKVNMNELISLIKENDNLIEELICDDIAVNILISFMQGKFGIPIEKILDAVYIGLMNLRVLGIINKQVLDFVENKSELENFFKVSNIRLMSFRDKANYHYGKYLNDFQRGFEIQEKLTNSNQKYSSLISDRLLFNVDEKVNLIKSRKNIEKTDIDLDKFFKNNEMLDIILSGKKS